MNSSTVYDAVRRFKGIVTLCAGDGSMIQNKSLATMTISIGAYVFLWCAGCSESKKEISETVDREPTPPFTVDDNKGFQKPERPYWPKEMSFGSTEGQDVFNKGESVSKRVRPHMAPDPQHNQSFLNVGEHFIMDISAGFFGEEGPKEASVYILSNFKKVPFFLDQVNSKEEFKDVNQVKGYYKSKVPAMHSDIAIKSGENKVFSIIIPPESFSEPGAYDLRITAIAKGKEESRRPLRPITINFSHTLFYGGTSFPELPPIFEQIDEIDATTRIARFVGSGLQSNTLALASQNPPDKDEVSINEEVVLDNENPTVYGIFRPNINLNRGEPAVLAFFSGGDFETLGTVYPKELPSNGIPQFYRVEHKFNKKGRFPVSFIMITRPLMDQTHINEYSRVIDVSNTLNVRVD